MHTRDENRRSGVSDYDGNAMTICNDLALEG